MSETACPSCGATLREGAATCDLCGTPAASAELSAPQDGEETAACARCGHVPPPGSTFCNRCGAPVAAVAPRDRAEPPVETAPTRPASDVGRRAFAIAAVGIGAVVGLYALTLWSGSDEPAPAPSPEVEAVGPAADIPEGAPPLPDSLQAAADAYAAQDSPAGWYESGRYYLTAAFNAAATDPVSSVRWARRAIADFEASLALADDPDVRFALAEASAFDPTNPMRPVQELQAVLAAEPDHVGATFMLGERRLMIGRVDSARVAFERVLALTEPGDPVRQRAEAALESIPTEG